MTPEERARWLNIADLHDRRCMYYQACCEMATREATAAIRQLVAAIAEEREACARMVERHNGMGGNKTLAARIRART